MEPLICPFKKGACNEECGVWNLVEKRCSIVVISTKLSKAVELISEIASAIGKE